MNYTQSGGGGTSTGGLSLSAGSNPTAPSDAPPGTVIAPLTATGLSTPSFSIIDPSGRYAISGNTLVAGDVAIDYTQGTTDTVKIRASDSSSAVEQTVALTVGPPSGPTAPVVDMNFVSASYTGATLSNVQVSQPNVFVETDSQGNQTSYDPNTPRVNDLGLHITDQSVEYLAEWSMDPDPANAHWHNYAAGWENVRWGAPVDKPGGWRAVTVTTNDANGATAYAPLKRDLVAGETINFRARFKPITAAMGAAIRYHGTVGATAVVVNDATQVGDANNITTQDANTTVLGTTVNSDGTMELHIKYVVPTSGPYEIGISMSQSATDAQMEYWGIQVMEGLNDPAWMATGATGASLAADTVTLTGPLAALLTSTTATIVVELDAPVVLPGAILSSGATDLLSIAGYTSASANGGEKVAAVGIGGFLGITRVGLARDATGYSLATNGGEVIQSTTVLTASAAVQLFKSLSGKVRRIIGWSTRLADADLKRFTSIVNRTLVNSAGKLNLTKASVTFEDDFKTNSIATRGAWPGTPGSWQQHMSYYQTSFNNGAKWMPGYVMATDERGGTLPGNNEWEWYADPEYAWADGYTSPFIFDGDKLTIRAQKASLVGSTFAAQLPNRQANGADTGVPYPYVSGAMTTAPGFGQKYGYFEMRAKLPKGQAIWPAFWLIPQDTLGGPPEIDIIEYLGKNPTQFWGTAHADYGANKVGVDPYETAIDLSQDFHTYAVLWEPGKIAWFLDGMMLGSKLSQDIIVDSHPYYILVNLAVGDNGNWVGQPDDTTPDVSDMVVDFIRVHQIV